jgi:transposase
MGEKRRRSFTRGYKIEAVKLVTEKGLTVAGAARDLGITENLLHRWKRQLLEDPGFELSRKSERLLEEVRQLRRENEVLRQEREILKKAAAYFAKESRGGTRSFGTIGRRTRSRCSVGCFG